MSQPMTPAAVHKQYDEAVTAFRRQITDAAARVAFGREADGFLRQCACGVWRADQALTPRHVEYYNAIYAKGNPVPTVLYWELASLVEEYDRFVLPGFFRRMIQADLERDTSQSRRFVDTFTLMLLLFAAVDGKVSEAEAGFVNSCADSLSSYCDHCGVKGGKSGLDVNEFVARRTDGRPVPTGKPEDEAAVPAPEKAGGAEAREAPPEPKPSLAELLAELDGLCGLDKVKEDVKGLINLVRGLRAEAGLPVPPMSLHLVFMGNPGTGKTTVARLLAKIYHAVGVLSKGQLVEVDRSGLVAGFVGQTALKTQEVIDKAIGGVLFIDEAYALASHNGQNDFGQEAVEVLLKNMEDHREDLIVIVAGYTDLMGEFIHSNPGLESRFNKYFYFSDYDGEEMLAIFRSMCEKNGYRLDEAAGAYAKEVLDELYACRDENFGNARDVRNFFERSVSAQSDRLAALEKLDKEALMALTADDLKKAAGEEEEGEKEP